LTAATTSSILQGLVRYSSAPPIHPASRFCGSSWTVSTGGDLEPQRADTILPIMFLLACLGGVLAGVSLQTLIH